jgi:hypothetical protein
MPIRVMSLPFSSGRDTSKGSGEPDPFLEFSSELNSSGSPLIRPLPGQQHRTEKSAVNPAFAFALGVAGVVMAAVAFYQLAQVLAARQGWNIGSLASSSSPAAQPSANAAPTGAQPNATPAPASISAPRSPATAGGSAPTASPAVPLGPPGWVVLDAHIDLQVFEGKQRIGSSRNSRLELPPGSHSLTLVNAECEIRQTLSVAVTSNQTMQLAVKLPSGSISLSALPWAQTWIDGVPVGTTPLANLSVPVGVHEIVWQHPTLGERRQSVTVKARTPVRIGVDYQK